MKKITVSGFRCFKEMQTARLAPLTLLVGENSTGKTSLMALIRSVWDIAMDRRVPDFRAAPYDLGSFKDIIHTSEAESNPPSMFEGECEFKRTGIEHQQGKGATENLRFKVGFGKQGTASVPAYLQLRQGDILIRDCFQARTFLRPSSRRVETRRGIWHWQSAREHPPDAIDDQRIATFSSLSSFEFFREEVKENHYKPSSGSPDISEEDWQELRDLARYFNFEFRRRAALGMYASAPVRSSPRRTYEPTRPVWDSEGDYVPMYLAELQTQNEEDWSSLQSALEGYGREAGLFDDITIRRLHEGEGEPFQLQVGWRHGNCHAALRNLADVGYGVSQVLPVLTELLRTGSTSLLLLQQPEIYLHPRAQAALGSLFCRLGGANRQLLVETHSDHLMDRIRMEVRDGNTPLLPEDVSILYFERQSRYIPWALTRKATYWMPRGATDGSSWKRSKGPWESDLCVIVDANFVSDLYVAASKAVVVRRSCDSWCLPDGATSGIHWIGS